MNRCTDCNGLVEQDRVCTYCITVVEFMGTRVERRKSDPVFGRAITPTVRIPANELENITEEELHQRLGLRRDANGALTKHPSSLPWPEDKEGES